MNRRTSLAVIAMALVVFLCPAPAAHAQDTSLSVDFPFVAAGKTLPAGTYTVATTPAGTVTLTPAPSGTAVDVAPLKPKADKKVDRTELVFEQVGSTWFLTEALVAGQGKFVVGKNVETQARRSVKAPKTK